MNSAVKYMVILAHIAVTSCFSQERDFQIIKSYIYSQTLHTRYDSIFFVKEAIPMGEVVTLYEKVYNGTDHFFVDPPSFDKWPFDADDILVLKTLPMVQVYGKT